MCKPISSSLYYISKTNTTLSINSTPIKFKSRQNSQQAHCGGDCMLGSEPLGHLYSHLEMMTTGGLQPLPERTDQRLLLDLGFGEGNGTPLQYSCLENPMDRGAWWAAVHGVTRSRTQLSDFTFTHWRRKWQPTPVFLPGESQGRGSLVGCHLWGCTESDTTDAT